MAEDMDLVESVLTDGFSSDEKEAMCDYIKRMKQNLKNYYINENDQEVKYGLINPRIIASSVKKCALRSGEGCLSVKQDHPGLVYRYFKITLKAFDIFSNKEIEINAKGYDAIVLQHELDHLSGILYYDRIYKSNPQIIIENSVLI